MERERIGDAIVATAGAIILPIALWGLLFDSDEGEPFAETIRNACLAWPVLAVLMIVGTMVLSRASGPRRAVLIVDAVLLVAVLIEWARLAIINL